MANANDFKITITALDRASATLRAVKAQLKTVVAPVTDIGRSAENLAKETGLLTLGRHAISAGRHLSALIAPLRVIGSLTAGLGVAGGLAGALSGAGLLELGRNWAEGAAELAEGEARTGVFVGQLARLHYAAKQSGVETTKLDKSLEFLNRTISGLVQGKKADIANAFREGGIDIWLDRTHRKVRSTASIFNQIAEAVKLNKDNRPYIEEIAKSLGLRGGDDLFPLMMRGKQGIKELGDEYDHLHGPFTRATGIAGKEAVEAWRRLDAATSGLKDSIGYALAPAITEVITPLTEWIAKNRDLIHTDVAAWAKDLADTLIHINWKKVGAEAKAFAHDLKVAFKDAFVVLQDIIKVLRFLDRNKWLFTGPLTGYRWPGKPLVTEIDDPRKNNRPKHPAPPKHPVRAPASVKLPPKAPAGAPRSPRDTEPQQRRLSDTPRAVPNFVMPMSSLVTARGPVEAQRFPRPPADLSYPRPSRRRFDGFEARQRASEPRISAPPEPRASEPRIIVPPALAPHVTLPPIDLASQDDDEHTLFVRFTNDIKRTARAFEDLLRMLDPYTKALKENTESQPLPSVTKHAAAQPGREAAPEFGALNLGTMADVVTHPFSYAMASVNSAAQTIHARAKDLISGRGVRTRTAMDFFTKHGWNQIAAAGITGNLLWESGGLNPRENKGDGGHAYGIAQWHRERAAEFLRVMHKPLAGSSLLDQLSFVNYELTKGSYKKIGDMLRKARSVADTTWIVNHRYESPAAPHASQPQRLHNAELALDIARSRRREASGPEDVRVTAERRVMSTPVIDRRQASNAPGRGPTDGTVRVEVDVKTPRGTTVKTAASGRNPPLLNTGRSWG